MLWGWVQANLLTWSLFSHMTRHPTPIPSVRQWMTPAQRRSSGQLPSSTWLPCLCSCERYKWDLFSWTLWKWRFHIPGIFTPAGSCSHSHFRSNDLEILVKRLPMIFCGRHSAQFQIDPAEDSLRAQSSWAHLAHLRSFHSGYIIWKVSGRTGTSSPWELFFCKTSVIAIIMTG